jgi:hypothetical protein
VPTPGQRRTEYSINTAARSLGYTYRHTRRLIAEGKLEATVKQVGCSPNQVRWTVSPNAIRRFKHQRAQRRAAK